MSGTSPPSVPPVPAPNVAPSPPPDESIRVLLSVSRTLALLFAGLAGLLFLLLLAFTVLDVVFGRGPGLLVTSIYCLASAAVLFVVWREIPSLQQLAANRQYAALRGHLLIWAILGLLFFVIIGVLLLVAWAKAELLANPSPG